MNLQYMLDYELEFELTEFAVEAPVLVKGEHSRHARNRAIIKLFVEQLQAEIFFHEQVLQGLKNSHRPGGVLIRVSF